ncbi:MAG: alanine racemase [Ruthenibacterium lactatiformans]
MMQTVTREQALAGTLALVNPASPAGTARARSVGPRHAGRARRAAGAAGGGHAGGAAGRHPRGGAHRARQRLAQPRRAAGAVSDSVRDNGLEFTQKYVALPGCSEHETGLAIDVGEAREVIDFIRPAFPDTGVCAAFRRAAARYGFIERYPKGAQAVTGIGHEPWHFRYVGWPHAGLMAQRGVTLEEYIGALGAYTPEQPLHAEAGGRGFDIFRVPLGPEGARFDAPRDRVCEHPQTTAAALSSPCGARYDGAAGISGRGPLPRGGSAAGGVHPYRSAGVFSAAADFALKTLARLAVPFFFTATGFFLLGELVRPGLRPRTLSPGVRRFLKKTGVLYAACTVLYLPVTLYAGNFPVENVLGELVRDAVLDGTFYHLWYLPAALLGVLVVCGLLRFLRPGAAAGVCGALYLAGLLGDSWYGLAKQLPALKEGYDALFGVMDYTRNGLFFAPAFLMLGALLAGFPARRRPRVCLAGLGCSLALLFAEAFGLRALGWPRHDSMYLALVPCACFLFLCLLVPRGGDAPFLREFSMLVYVLHPMAIVGVRGAARVLHAREWLVENSLAHFAAVAAASCAAAWLLARLSQRRRWDGRSGTAPKPDLRRARAWAEVDLEAVARNAGALQGCMPAGCRLMAVVKADAYGHGAPAVAGRLWQAGVRAFAVATPEEGAQLRRCGITGEILVLGYADAARIRELRRWRLCQTVTDPAHARALARAAGRRPLPVHIAVDTGMHRLGTDAGAAPAVAEMLRLPGLEVRGLFTHLAVADSPAPEDAAFTRTQLDAFEALARKLRGAGYTLPPLHAQASCGILNQPQPDCGYARPGITLRRAQYGGLRGALHPVLAPALALRARVVSVRRVPPGEGAGYGLAFRARRSTRLAVVAIGYADGWPRAAGEGRGHVLLHGRRAPVVGRVCMDQLLVDATDTGAAVGDVATLIGADGPERITAEEAAEAAAPSPTSFCAASVPACPAFICAEKTKAPRRCAHNAAGLFLASQ